MIYWVTLYSVLATTFTAMALLTWSQRCAITALILWLFVVLDIASLYV